MARIFKIALWLAALCLAALVGLAWFISANTPKRERFLIPEGYFGWLCVTYSVPAEDPLELEDGYRLVKFPSSGVVVTSTEGMPGKYKDEYYFYSASGRREVDFEAEMGGGYTVASLDAPERFTLMFWVSPNAKEQQPSSSRQNEHRCGPESGGRT